MDMAIMVLWENELTRSCRDLVISKWKQRYGPRRSPHTWLSEKMCSSFSNVSIWDGTLWETLLSPARIWRPTPTSLETFAEGHSKTPCYALIYLQDLAATPYLSSRNVLRRPD